MDPRPFTLSAVSLGILAVAVLGLHVISPVVDRSGRISLRRTIDSVQLEYATAVAIASMAGSLVMSEIVGFIPCRLCWIQRGFMYPAATFLLIETLHVNVRKKPSGALIADKLKCIPIGAVVAVLLAVPGLGVSIYHRYIQSQDGPTGFCDAAAPCTTKYFNYFGLVSIPVLAGVGFVSIIYFGTRTIRAFNSAKY